MKLYATVLSERGKPASKGGNKYVYIALTDKEGGEKWAEIKAEHVNTIQESEPLDEIRLTVKILGVERFARTHYAKR